MSTISKPRVPEGLRDLMKELTREILKEKPTDIYSFAENYFQSRLPEKEIYAVTGFETCSGKYDFSYIQTGQGPYQAAVTLVYSIIPENLTNLIKELIKAVLREQPKNLCDFAVEYFRHIKAATSTQSKEINYSAYENYFRDKERYLFTPYVKCICGRTLGKTYSNCYQSNNLISNCNNECRSQSESQSTINNNENNISRIFDSTYSEKYMNSIYIIQRYLRCHLKRKNVTTKNKRLPLKRVLTNTKTEKSKHSKRSALLQSTQNETENNSNDASYSYTSASTDLLSVHATSELSTTESIPALPLTESDVNNTTDCSNHSDIRNFKGETNDNNKGTENKIIKTEERIDEVLKIENDLTRSQQDYNEKYKSAEENRSTKSDSEANTIENVPEEEVRTDLDNSAKKFTDIPGTATVLNEMKQFSDSEIRIDKEIMEEEYKLNSTTETCKDSSENVNKNTNSKFDDKNFKDVKVTKSTNRKTFNENEENKLTDIKPEVIDNKLPEIKNYILSVIETESDKSEKTQNRVKNNESIVLNTTLALLNEIPQNAFSRSDNENETKKFNQHNAHPTTESTTHDEENKTKNKLIYKETHNKTEIFQGERNEFKKPSNTNAIMRSSDIKTNDDRANTDKITKDDNHNIHASPQKMTFSNKLAKTENETKSNDKVYETETTLHTKDKLETTDNIDINENLSKYSSEKFDQKSISKSIDATLDQHLEKNLTETSKIINQNTDYLNDFTQKQIDLHKQSTISQSDEKVENELFDLLEEDFKIKSEKENNSIKTAEEFGTYKEIQETIVDESTITKTNRLIENKTCSTNTAAKANDQIDEDTKLEFTIQKYSDEKRCEEHKIDSINTSYKEDNNLVETLRTFSGINNTCTSDMLRNNIEESSDVVIINTKDDITNSTEVNSVEPQPEFSQIDTQIDEKQRNSRTEINKSQTENKNGITSVTIPNAEDDELNIDEIEKNIQEYSYEITNESKKQQSEPIPTNSERTIEQKYKFDEFNINALGEEKINDNSVTCTTENTKLENKNDKSFIDKNETISKDKLSKESKEITHDSLDENFDLKQEMQLNKSENVTDEKNNAVICIKSTPHSSPTNNAIENSQFVISSTICYTIDHPLPDNSNDGQKTYENVEELSQIKLDEIQFIKKQENNNDKPTNNNESINDNKTATCAAPSTEKTYKEEEDNNVEPDFQVNLSNRIVDLASKAVQKEQSNFIASETAIESTNKNESKMDQKDIPTSKESNRVDHIVNCNDFEKDKILKDSPVGSDEKPDKTYLSNTDSKERFADANNLTKDKHENESLKKIENELVETTSKEDLIDKNVDEKQERLFESDEARNVVNELSDAQAELIDINTNIDNLTSENFNKSSNKMTSDHMSTHLITDKNKTGTNKNELELLERTSLTRLRDNNDNADDMNTKIVLEDNKSNVLERDSQNESKAKIIDMIEKAVNEKANTETNDIDENQMKKDRVDKKITLIGNLLTDANDYDDGKRENSSINRMRQLQSHDENPNEKYNSQNTSDDVCNGKRLKYVDKDDTNSLTTKKNSSLIFSNEIDADKLVEQQLEKPIRNDANLELQGNASTTDSQTATTTVETKKKLTTIREHKVESDLNSSTKQTISYNNKYETNKDDSQTSEDKKAKKNDKEFETEKNNSKEDQSTIINKEQNQNKCSVDEPTQIIIHTETFSYDTKPEHFPKPSDPIESSKETNKQHLAEHKSYSANDDKSSLQAVNELEITNIQIVKTSNEQNLPTEKNPEGRPNSGNAIDSLTGDQLEKCVDIKETNQLENIEVKSQNSSKASNKNENKKFNIDNPVTDSSNTNQHKNNTRENFRNPISDDKSTNECGNIKKIKSQDNNQNSDGESFERQHEDKYSHMDESNFVREEKQKLAMNEDSRVCEHQPNKECKKIQTQSSIENQSNVQDINIASNQSFINTRNLNVDDFNSSDKTKEVDFQQNEVSLESNEHRITENGNTISKIDVTETGRGVQLIDNNLNELADETIVEENTITERHLDLKCDSNETKIFIASPEDLKPLIHKDLPVKTSISKEDVANNYLSSTLKHAEFIESTTTKESDQKQHKEENSDAKEDNAIDRVHSGKETTHNIGNQNPEIFIGNQNLAIGRIKNFNNGLLGSISGQRFAETHLRSFWKEYVMNNSTPLSQYDYIENDVKEQAISAESKEINETNLTSLINRNKEHRIDIDEHESVNELITQSESTPVNIRNSVLNRPKDIERIPRYFTGIPDTDPNDSASHAKRKLFKEPTAFTIPIGDAIENDSTTPATATMQGTTNHNNKKASVKGNRKNNLPKFKIADCTDVEPRLDAETPTKLFYDLNQLDYEIQDADLDITYTIDEIIRLKILNDSQNNSDDNKDGDEASEYSLMPAPMLHTIIEFSESEIPKVQFQSISADFLVNCEDISDNICTSCAASSKKDTFFVSGEFLDEDRYGKTATKSDPRHENLDKIIANAPSPPNYDPFVADQKNTAATIIQKFYRKYNQKNETKTVHGTSDCNQSLDYTHKQSVYKSGEKNNENVSPPDKKNAIVNSDIASESITIDEKGENLKQNGTLTLETSDNTNCNKKSEVEKQNVLMENEAVNIAINNSTNITINLNQNDSLTVEVTRQSELTADTSNTKHDKTLESQATNHTNNEMRTQKKIVLDKNTNTATFNYLDINNKSDRTVDNMNYFSQYDKHIPQTYSQSKCKADNSNDENIYRTNSSDIPQTIFVEKIIKNTTNSDNTIYSNELKNQEQNGFGKEFGNNPEDINFSSCKIVEATHKLSQNKIVASGQSTLTADNSNSENTNSLVLDNVLAYDREIATQTKYALEKETKKNAATNSVGENINKLTLNEEANKRPTLNSDLLQVALVNNDSCIESNFSDSACVYSENIEYKEHESENRTSQKDCEITTELKNGNDAISKQTCNSITNETNTSETNNTFKENSRENSIYYWEPTAPAEADVQSTVSIESNKSINSRLDQAARKIQKSFRKFIKQKSKLNSYLLETTESSKSNWYVGDEPIKPIPNNSLTKTASEISLEETEAYVELTTNPSQYLVNFSSNLDNIDVNSLSRSPTAPISNRSKNSVDLNNYLAPNTSKDIVSLTEKSEASKGTVMGEHNSIIKYSSNDKSEESSAAIHLNESELLNKENAIKCKNLIDKFITAERYYSDAVNSRNLQIGKFKEIKFTTPDITELTKIFSEFAKFEKGKIDSGIPYERLEDPCIKKSISRSCNSADSVKDDKINDGATVSADNTSSDIDDDAEDSLSKKTIKLHKAEMAITKMQQRRDCTTKITGSDNSKDYYFDEPLVAPIDNLDADEEGIVARTLKREQTCESSAESDVDVVIGEYNNDKLIHRNTTDIADTDAFPPKGSLKVTYTHAPNSETKFLLKNVTIDESVKYIEPPDYELNSDSLGLDEDIAENIRRKMMAYSLSEADSDCFDKSTNNAESLNSEHKIIKYDDFNVSTALVENSNSSTETESTIVSAVTKIQAGTRGYLTRKHLGKTIFASNDKSMHHVDANMVSFGNAAISESLEYLVQEEAAKKIQKAYRQYYRQKIGYTYRRDNKNFSPQLATCVENTLAQKRYIMLQRGDAVRNDSTPDETNSSSSRSNASESENGKLTTKSEENNMCEIISSTDQSKICEEKYIGETFAEKHSLNASSTGKTAAAVQDNKKRWPVMRQNSMPVQIDSEVLRVIPKHMRKKIKSAEGEKKNHRKQMIIDKLTFSTSK